MKNINYFPMERNRYFYGKLLSVDDFETEQKYMNNKRRLINRFLSGTGVVCGMNVVVVDERTLSLEMGFALDYAGREIIVDTPITKKLSMIDGFDTYTEADEENSYLYLCIEYAEQEYEAVHSITGGMSGDGGAEFNKYREGFHLFLTNQEPDNITNQTTRLCEECKTVYWGNGIRIKQTMPKYAKSNGDLCFKLIVENMGQQQPISLQYDMELACLTHQGENRFTVCFQEADYEKSSHYELSYSLDVMPVRDVVGEAKVLLESFHLKIGERVITGATPCVSQVSIIEGNIQERIIKAYYESGMESLMMDPYQHYIYLAKINIIKAGTTYIMDYVENMPFAQYAYNHILSQVMNELALHELETRNHMGGPVLPQTKGVGNDASVGCNYILASGYTVFSLGIGGIAGKKYYSEPIAHGLGLGKVQIILGIADGMKEESPFIYGTPDVFEPEDDGVSADLAAKADNTNGTFVIGLKLRRVTTARSVKVCWTAFKEDTAGISGKQERRVIISPNMLYLTVRETRYFEAKITGTDETEVTWRVKEPDGGSINENGMYIAPNKAGIYEIIAESKAYSDLRASAFVVVRDQKSKKKAFLGKGDKS